MATVALVQLGEHIDDELLLEVARMMGGSPVRLRCGFVEGPEIQLEDDEIEPFLDWDHDRGHGRGGYAQDVAECRSRRVDLRGPTDLDPGPLPMEEAPDDLPAHHLTLAPPTA
jgi:hypothetical protein